MMFDAYAYSDELIDRVPRFIDALTAEIPIAAGRTKLKVPVRVWSILTGERISMTQFPAFQINWQELPGDGDNHRARLFSKLRLEIYLFDSYSNDRGRIAASRYLLKMGETVNHLLSEERGTLGLLRAKPLVRINQQSLGDDVPVLAYRCEWEVIVGQ